MTELGNRLKEARLAKGLSLDAVQNLTKIQKRYLQDIEEGNYSAMPGKFYVRAFIKQYAEQVGLEPEELFEEYKSEIPSSVNEDLPGQLSRVQTRKSITYTGSKLFDFLPKILIIVIIIGVFMFIWFLAQKYAGNSANDPATDETKNQVTYEESANLTKDKSKTETEVKKTEEKKSTAVKENKKDEKAQDLTVAEAAGNKSVYELKNADKFELKVVSTGETWVSIKNGKGYSFFQGILKKDATESQTFDLSKETDVVIVAGKSTETEIYVNGQKLEYAISPAEKVSQNIIIRNVKSE